MSSYTLQNTATEIDSAISRVTSADTEPVSNSQNMVTSGGVRAALNTLSGGSTTDLTSVIDYINILATPPQMSITEFRFFPYAHSQGQVVFNWSVPGVQDAKGNSSYNIVVHAYNQGGTQISSTPVANVTVTVPNDNGGSGTFTGTFTTTETGYMKFSHNYTALNTTFLVSTASVQVVVTSSNPSITTPLGL